jgi:hypothetical protein
VNGKGGARIRGRNSRDSASVRLDYFIANEQAEAEPNTMVIGGSFQSQRIEKGWPLRLAVWPAHYYEPRPAPGPFHLPL